MTRQQSAKQPKQKKRFEPMILGQVKIIVEATVVTNSSLSSLNFRCLIKLLCDVNGRTHTTAFRTMYFMCKTSFSNLFAALVFVYFQGFSFVVVCLLTFFCRTLFAYSLVTHQSMHYKTASSFCRFVCPMCSICLDVKSKHLPPLV